MWRRSLELGLLVYLFVYFDGLIHITCTQAQEKSLDSRLIGGIGFYAASIGTDVGRRLPVGGPPGGSSVEGDSEGSAAWHCECGGVAFSDFALHFHDCEFSLFCYQARQSEP